MAGYVDAIKLATVSSDEVLFSVAIRQWAVAAWSLSIATQVSASSLIAWKVWRTHIGTGTGGHYKNKRSMPIVWIVLECGAVLSFSHVFLLALYVERTIAGSVIVAMIGQLDVSLTVTMHLYLLIGSSRHSFQPPSCCELS